MAQRVPDQSPELLEFSLEAVRTLIRAIPGEADLAELAARVSADLAGNIEDWLRGTDSDVSFEPLTEREAVVARLVARGLTNTQIAARLHVSRATVSTHVAHVLAKLGFRSRAQVAAWVTRREG